MAAVYGNVDYSRYRPQCSAILISSASSKRLATRTATATATTTPTITATAKPSTSNAHSSLAQPHKTALNNVVSGVAKIIYSLQGKTDSKLEISQFIEDVSPTLYKEAIMMLNKHSDPSVANYFDTKLGYEYDERLKTLIIKCETKQHENVSEVLRDLKEFLATANEFYPDDWASKVKSGGAPSKHSILPLNYSLLTHKLLPIAIKLNDNNRKGEFKPDGTLWISGRDEDFPTLILEVAHSQTEEDLLKVGKRWLMGSNGRICTVILIKINYPLPVQEVKIWVYRVVEVEQERRISKWGPGIIYRAPPATIPEPDRTLDLSLKDVLGKSAVLLPVDIRQRSVSIPFHLLALWCQSALEDIVWPNAARILTTTKTQSKLGKRLRTPESDEEQTSQETVVTSSPSTHSDKGDRYRPSSSKAPIPSGQGREIRPSTKRARQSSNN